MCRHRLHSAQLGARWISAGSPPSPGARDYPSVSHTVAKMPIFAPINVVVITQFIPVPSRRRQLYDAPPEIADGSLRPRRAFVRGLVENERCLSCCDIHRAFEGTIVEQPSALELQATVKKGHIRTFMASKTVVDFWRLAGWVTGMIVAEVWGSSHCNIFVSRVGHSSQARPRLRNARFVVGAMEKSLYFNWLHAGVA
ncbi:hypothetical protein BDU57DRAFT_57154 [Ampelomyces quisqualis]|uniref:Uncharacterized protein n=1 Tax=Ampelomyces quisqualis TaxID=50730 RepID=A0A6A5R4G5_AMPQU|nr:hypothetical protein BDU57DRAFT_57154 [Ampelomyces quisqualis]